MSKFDEIAVSYKEPLTAYRDKFTFFQADLQLEKECLQAFINHVTTVTNLLKMTMTIFPSLAVLQLERGCFQAFINYVTAMVMKLLKQQCTLDTSFKMISILKEATFPTTPELLISDNHSDKRIQPSKAQHSRYKSVQ